MDKKSFALITGASSGIGLATAKLLAKKGKNLILLARRLNKLQEIQKELIEQEGIEVLVYQVDLLKEKEIEKFFTDIAPYEIDTVINNAGKALDRTELPKYDWKDIEQMIELNIKAFTKVAKLSIPFLEKTRGHMVNLSSVAGIEAYEGASVYCSTKAYVKMLSKALRIDLQGSDIRITDIAPGAVETEFSLVRFKGDENMADKVYAGYEPLRAEDIAESIVFALMQPKHVNIEHLLIMPTAQASATRITKT